MRALRGARRALSLESPDTPLSGDRLLSEVTDPNELWSSEGGASSPLKLGTALRCIQIISSAVAGCPIKTFHVHDNETFDVPALRAERPGMTPFERVETEVAHIVGWGNSFTRKVRTRDGRIKELVPIHPNRVAVDVVDGSDVGMPYVKKFTVDGKVPLTEYDIMHVPGFSFDGVTGVSVLTAARRIFDITASAEAAAERMYRKGLMVSGFLSVPEPINQEQAHILQARWRAKLAGLDNAYEVAVLDNGAKFEQATLKPDDAQFLESRKFQTTEIARLFGVPGWMINDQEKSTSWGSGMEQQFTAFVMLTLKPYMQRMEQRYTRELLNPLRDKAEFKVEGLLRGDTKSRAAFYASGIQHGWLVPNDVRPLEGYGPVEWGDVPYRPYNESASDQDPSTDDTSEEDTDDDDE